SRTRLLCVLVLDDFPTLHYKLHSLKRGHIFDWIAVYRDDVGPGAGFERADFALPAEQVGGVDGGGLNRLKRREAESHHDGEFVRVHTVRIDGGIGAEGDFDSGGEGAGDILARGGDDFLGFGQQGRRKSGQARVVDHPVTEIERGDEIGAVFFHGSDGGVIDV